MRKKHRKELEQMLAIGEEGLDEVENQEFMTRDGRDKTINIQLTSLTTIGISSNFSLPDQIMKMARECGAVWN